LLNIFDHAENAFVTAYRKHSTGEDFEIAIEYVSSPAIQDKILLLCDPMLASGASMHLTYKALLEKGEAKHTHILSIVSSTQGIEYLRKKINPKKQISYADTDARIMKKGGDFSYCYNAQVSVDSKDQIIVGCHLTQNANDKKELGIAIDEIKKNTGSLPEKVTADSGYRSSENILTLKDSSIDGYIATGKGEKDPEVKGKIGIKNFSYNQDKDVFVCPAGQILEFKSTGKKRIYKAPGACRECVYRKRCAACKKDTATVYIDDGGIILAAMAEKMREDSSRKIYGKRKIIVEPVFGQIKTAGFRRFSLRGYEKAGGEFSLVCAVLNFKKIVKKIKMDISNAKKGGFEPAVA